MNDARVKWGASGKGQRSQVRGLKGALGEEILQKGQGGKREKGCFPNGNHEKKEPEKGKDTRGRINGGSLYRRN